MNKEEIKKEMLAAISQEIDKWMDESNKIKSGYDYETQFLAYLQNVGKIILKKSLGEIPKDRKKKRKLLTCMGSMEVSKKHLLAQIQGPFRITEKVRELMCLIGQSEIFKEGEELFLKMMHLDISAKQIQRVSEYYGEQIELLQEKAIEEGAPLPAEGEKEEKVYCMIDGSMIFTREEGWKEMKMGRLFSEKDCIPIQPERHEILQSEYVCHLGGQEEFLRKMEWHVDQYSQQKICVADGAVWIWNWVEQTYPEAIQILDFFHAVEKLGQYAAYQIEDESDRKTWINTQKKYLLKNKVTTIIDLLKEQQGRTPEAEKARNDVIRYYQNNQKRMQYKTYRDNGYLIGSGAIESAHRNIVQKRLKQSGQRWSKKGAQRIINLRAYHKSNKWDMVINTIKKAA